MEKTKETKKAEYNEYMRVYMKEWQKKPEEKERRRKYNAEQYKKN